MIVVIWLIRLIIYRDEGPRGMERMKELGRPNFVIIPQIRTIASDQVRFVEGLKAVVVSTPPGEPLRNA